MTQLENTHPVPAEVPYLTDFGTSIFTTMSAVAREQDAIPATFFYDHQEKAKTLTRFAFCKDEATLGRAGKQLAPLQIRLGS